MRSAQQLSTQHFTNPPRPPGSFVSIPAGAVHYYRVLTADATFLVLTSPSGAAAFFEEMDRETGGSCDDMETVIRVAMKHAVMVPPPA